MHPKKAVLSILGVCILILCAFFTTSCTGIGQSSGLQVLAVPSGDGNGEATYSLQFPVICYSFIIAIILFLVLFFISTKQISEIRNKGK